MGNKYKIIDESTWERAMHCKVFRDSIEPSFCVTFELNITNFLKKTKGQGLSFTLSMVHAVCKCANDIEAFRYRFMDDKIVLFDRIDTAFTYLNQDTELFKVINVPFLDDIVEYVEMAAKTAKEQKDYFTGPLRNDVFQCSPMPWLHIPIYPIPIPEKKTMQLRYLTGVNTGKRTAKSLCRYPFKSIILL